MLSPHDRSDLFSVLRPTPGYVFDCAVATTFTLDLEALLTAPIAFALFEAEDADLGADDGLEPVGLLEAIRRHAERVTVFCQAGQIAVPRRYRTVFAWLEESVVEVSAPRAHRLFHPKLWVTRYAETSGGRHMLRVLCATRNLTFDTSWDTLLVLESDPFEADAPRTVEENRPLADLVRSLPSLASHPVSAERLAAASLLADDLERARLAVPEPFESMQFHALGLGESTKPFPSTSDRAAVISPFLGDGLLDQLTHAHSLSLLLSREESLDRVDPEILDRVERLAVLHSAAEVTSGVASDETSPDENDAAATRRQPGEAFGGLHAKLFVFDVDDRAHLFTGSANATASAFNGNVELLVELDGPVEAGVGALVEDSPGETGLDDLLLDYRPLETPLGETDAEQLGLDVERLRVSLAAIPFSATVSAVPEGFGLLVRSASPLLTLDNDELELSIWPATLLEDQASRTLHPGLACEESFHVSLEGITSFFVVRATATRDSTTVTSTFLVNADLEDAPSDRHSRLLAAMLRDTDRLLRYLILLLSDDAIAADGALTGAANGWLDRWTGAGWDEIPMLELLVRAVDRFPDRLDQIKRLLDDLGDERDQVLPPDFAAIWEPLWRAREVTKR